MHENLLFVCGFRCKLESSSFSLSRQTFAPPHNSLIRSILFAASFMGLHWKVYAAKRQSEQKSEKASALLQTFLSRQITEALFRTLECSCFLALSWKSCGVRTCIGLFSNGYVWAATPNRARAFRQYCQNKFGVARDKKAQSGRNKTHLRRAVSEKRGFRALSDCGVGCVSGALKFIAEFTAWIISKFLSRRLLAYACRPG